MSIRSYYTERELLDALVNKQEDAYRYIIEKYRNPLIRLCRGFTGSTEDASDLAQEIFLEVFQSVSKFKGQSSLSTWIYRIAVNKSINFKRDKGKRSSENESELHVATGVPGEGADADESIIRKDHARALHTAIDKLPENQKTAFILSKYEEMTYTEIAEIMKTSVSSVESLLFRAKKNLQKSLLSYYKKNFK